MTAIEDGSPLALFSPAVAAWFATTFAAPTPAQARGWPAIGAGKHTLVLAPTGSGKTLAAFLSAIDALVTAPDPESGRRCRVVYVSPLKALAVDIERNLRAPLAGIRLAGERVGQDVREVTIGVRTGDTPQSERRRMARTPPDILITTPESLYLLLTSRAREVLRDVDTVIIDEIHAVAATKRGSHLAVSLERLEDQVRRGAAERDEEFRAPQRIALSATQRPLDEIARFLGGFELVTDADGARRHQPRAVTTVDAGTGKELQLEVVMPVQDMAELGQAVAEPDLLAGPAAAGPQRASIWPAMHPRLLDLVTEHTSTILFVNSRRLAERLAARLNDLHVARVRVERLRAIDVDPDTLDPQDPDLPPRIMDLLDSPVEELVLAHHGSLSKARRGLVEDQLKAGQVRGLVATSSLELGIDMGAVDLVVQVGSPGSVARGLQRIGRAGHRVGEPSRGRLFPKFRGDLLETAVVTRAMHAGDIEALAYPRLPLDVLAQQVVAMVAMDDWNLAELAELLRSSAPFVDLSDDVLAATLDLLSGRYPSDEFSELRPRITWDRVTNELTARPGAQRLAVTNPGTIPDRGLYGVFLPDGSRVGELDEEMVHESRTGETFLLGASTWRIQEITHDRVVVTPAPGVPAKMPFWHGDGPGRPVELGTAMGVFVRELRNMDPSEAIEVLRDDHDLDAWAADNLVAYLEEQAEAAGAVPDDRTIVVERFRDELGDWRLCLLSHFGARVHAPWAMALEAQLGDRGLDPEVMWTDDGIVVRLDAAADDLDLDAWLVDPDEVEALVTGQLADTALFTTIFREAAGRALLLPKRRPGQRTALWQQRQRAANLLAVARGHPSFPLLLEATREILRDVFDVPALRDLLADLRARKVRLVSVDTDQASPFASSLLFSWVGQWMYDYDAPLAERRAAALSLDPDLLRDLLGGDELRDLLDADVLASLEVELQRLAPTDPDHDLDRRARDPDEVHNLLLDVGDLTVAEVVARTRPPGGGGLAVVEQWLDGLVRSRRLIRVRVGGEARVAAAEDAARLRDGIGVALPPGLPAAFTDPVADPLADLVSRYARTHGPFVAADVVARLGVPRARVTATLQWLAQRDRVVVGQFRPGGTDREWCDSGVLRRLRQRSLAALRREVEPVDEAAYTRFLLAWHSIASPRRDSEALVDSIGQLQGAAIPASILETEVLAMRIADYAPSDLDALLSTGEVVWVGVEPIGSADGRVMLAFREVAAALVAALPRGDDPPDDPVHDRLRAHLATAGASFWPELFAASGVADQEAVLAALWDLVWAGEVTNDSFAAVRGMLAAGSRRPSLQSGRRGRPRPGRLRRVGPPAAAGRWSLTASLAPGDGPDAGPGSKPGSADQAVGGRDRGSLDRGRETTAATVVASQLLERHGVVTAEGTRAEWLRGGYASVYPVLKAMEANGTVRRGWFVAGLGAAQFAVPGVVDRLRDHREATPDDVVVLAAADPAQPYGAALAWPPTDGRPSRSAGAHVVLVDGHLAVYLERGARSLVTFPAAGADGHWVDALVGLVSSGRVSRLQLRRVDGLGIHESPWADVLRSQGFVDEPRGLTHRGIPVGRG